ncbi:FecR family protein [Parapedobacter deserti]|uniref:FecR family protein n=1 Tax=Parapedobacter deserti TaxID=1912957 RepID=A0ABV7JJY0_9SPHI
MDKDRLHLLLKRQLAKGLQEEELLELKHFNEDEIKQALNELLDERSPEQPSDPSDHQIPSERIYREILRHPHVAAGFDRPKKHDRRLWHSSVRWVGGTAALLCVGLFLFVFVNDWSEAAPPPATATAAADPIVPGGNRATLTLADGRTITLNEEQETIAINTDNITYGDGTQLIEHSHQIDDFQQFATPRGGTYRITLSDGTEVCLNADSKLRYPLQFTGNERVVELDGEAFFDVAEQQTAQGRRPFLVKTKSQIVEVLGTQFNISAYRDEAAEYTTLIEGSVRISGNDRHTVQLVPGEQGIVYEGKPHVKTVDVSVFTAWKDGYFAFSDTHIQNVMASIARWYNIDVEYDDDELDAYFGGTISRFSDFETLLETIELTGSVKFKIVGRRVIVMT